MKAFVVGATGYVGRAVVEKLRENGADVVGHVRPDSSRLQMWRQRFEAMGAEVSSCPFDVDAFATLIETERVDAVFALLGTTRARGWCATVFRLPLQPGRRSARPWRVSGGPHAG